MNEQNLYNIRAKHIKTLIKLKDAMDSGKLLTFSELKDAQTPSSSFCRHVQDLIDGEIIRKFRLDGKEYYGLCLWGEVLCNIETEKSSVAFWTAMITYQTMYELVK